MSPLLPFLLPSIVTLQTGLNRCIRPLFKRPIFHWHRRALLEMDALARSACLLFYRALLWVHSVASHYQVRPVENTNGDVYQQYFTYGRLPRNVNQIINTPGIKHFKANTDSITKLSCLTSFALPLVLCRKADPPKASPLATSICWLCFFWLLPFSRRFNHRLYGRLRLVYYGPCHQATIQSSFLFTLNCGWSGDTQQSVMEGSEAISSS